MTNLEAKQRLAGKLDINYSDIANNGLLSDSDLQEYIQAGTDIAWDMHPWPFAKKTKTVTTISTAYYDYPSDLAQQSVYLLKIAGAEFKKVEMEDYLAYLNDYPTGTDRIWAEQEGYIFVNPSAYSIGAVMDLYGKKVSPTLSASGDLLPFSPITDNNQYSGNSAVVEMAYSEALSSRKFNDPPAAQSAFSKATAILASLWKPFADNKAFNQSKSRQMFDLPDTFGDKGQRFTAGNFDV